MSDATLDHQIVLARDKHESAEFLVSLLGLKPPEPQSIFVAVELGNSSTILFKTVQGDFPGQHYAFRVPPAAFPIILQRAKAQGTRYWAKPSGDGDGQTYELNGDTGFYFHYPSGHQLEVLTNSAGLTNPPR